METEAKEQTAGEKITATMAALGLTVTAQFVPWSQSRNKNEKEENRFGGTAVRPRLSLNWRVTLTNNDRAILTTDYSAGIAHCPAYKAGPLTVDVHAAIQSECETGLRMAPIGKRKPIMPNACDVVASLVMDSSVLDESSFEDWASSLGYDTDSRKAETLYRACLDIALKLRAGIGEDGLQQLRDACQDY